VKHGSSQEEVDVQEVFGEEEVARQEVEREEVFGEEEVDVQEVLGQEEALSRSRRRKPWGKEAA
jgi:hypothetical protein